MKNRPPAQPNQSLQGGIECLLQLAAAGRPIGSREMARELGMEHTRANRLLGTLAYLGLAEQTSERKYVPGPGIHALTAMSLRGSRLLTSALPHIRTLMEETGLTVALGVLWRKHVCYLYHGSSRKALHAAIAGYDLYPAERSSIGLILLAQRTPEEVKTLYQSRAKGAKTNRDIQALLRELRDIRRQEYALSESGSLAVSLGYPPTAGLAVAGRFRKKQIPALVKQLRKAADRIAADCEEGTPR